MNAKKNQKIRLLFEYLKEKSGFLLLTVVGMALFWLVLFLYQVPAEPVLYASVLYLLLLLIVGGADFYFYQKRHWQRQTTLANLPLMLDELPKKKTLAEKELQEMAEKLAVQLETERTRREMRKREEMDYYTTWVHQIKTPIAAMKLLLDSEDSDLNRDLNGELFRVSQYAEMALDYLRLDSSSTDYLFKEYPLDPILRQSVRKFAPQFIRRRIRLEYTPTEQTALTDEKWLSFIVEQLLSNSIKYTPANGTVSIRVTQAQVLEISDTGIGIAPEDIPRVFEKGFTGYNGRADKKATGLGLYLCKKAADRLGHTLSIRSAPGAGTVVLLSLSSGPRVRE